MVFAMLLTPYDALLTIIRHLKIFSFFIIKSRSKLSIQKYDYC